jgi:hypothetical protein
MFVFPVERAADGSERLGQRKDIGRDKQIGIFGSYRMPINPFRCNRDFRHQIGASECNAFCRRSAQRDPANHPIFRTDLLFIQELTEVLSFRIG